MADSKISALTAQTTVATDDMFPLATAAGATKKITGANLRKATDQAAFVASLMGVKSWSKPPEVVGSGNAASGTAQYSLLPFRAGDTVTNIHFLCPTAPTTITLIKAGLRDTAGASLGASADVSATFGAAGLKTIALSSPYAFVADTWAYAGILVVATGAGSFGRLTTAAVGYTPYFDTSEAGQTDWDSTATLAASTYGICVGWS